MKIQARLRSDAGDEEMRWLKLMGISDVFVIFRDEHTDYDAVQRFLERLRFFGLTCSDAGNTNIYKNDKIHLGLPGRDQAIQEYIDFHRVLAKAGVHTGYMTWEPNRVLTSGKEVDTRGARCRTVRQAEIEGRPFTHGRFYSNEEIWENFRYFWQAVSPALEEFDMRIILHPNDPPIPAAHGISNLITSADDFRRAFAIAEDSPRLGMKFCVGCWLEGADAFGPVLQDLAEFVQAGRVFSVHFRNVSAPLPDFTETLLEDGYMNMYSVMKTLVEAEYTGFVYVDHVPERGFEGSGKLLPWTYSIGYTKGLLHATVSSC